MFNRTRSFFQRLTGSAQSSGPSDRRLWERHATEHEARVRLDADSGPITARVEDVSRGGIRMQVDELIPSGTMISVDLPPLEPDPRTTVLACVVHSRPAGSGKFSLGCNFSTELSDADLQALGAQRLKPKQGDQRYWERVRAAGQALYSRVNPPGEPRPGEIHNISPTGVALRTEEELAPGTLVNVELRDQSGRAVVSIVACVVYLTTLQDGLWLAGCNFIRELDDEDLKALVLPAAG